MHFKEHRSATLPAAASAGNRARPPLTQSGKFSNLRVVRPASLLSAALAGLFFCAVASAQQNPNATTSSPASSPAVGATPALRGLQITDAENAKDKIYVLQERISVTTDAGILSLSPGTMARVVEDKGETLVLSDGEHTFEVKRSQVKAASEHPAPKASPNLSDDLAAADAVVQGLKEIQKGDFKAAQRFADRAGTLNPSDSNVMKLRSRLALIAQKAQVLAANESKARDSSVANAQAYIEMARKEYATATDAAKTYAQTELPNAERRKTDLQALRTRLEEVNRNLEEARQRAEANKIWWRYALIITGVIVGAVVIYLLWPTSRKK